MWPALLSALNILNEAEINYRQSRNKRLHVELTLIKLCYLQQAIELVNDGGHLHKKKQLESVRPVAFKSISAVAVKEKNIASPAESSLTNGKKPTDSQNGGNGQLQKR